MNYFIKRELNEYGPYSLADLQKYVASGNILLTDLCRSEGLTDWVPVSQVIGNIPVPAAPQPVAPAAYGAAGTYAAPVASQYPPPPNLHWGICLLLAIVSCTLFAWVWAFVQAAWVKKVQPDSKALAYYGAAAGIWLLSVCFGLYYGISLGMQGVGAAGLTAPGFRLAIGIARLAILTVAILGNFNMRESIEEHFNTAEPIGLSLSGVLTFFFGIIYFQYHFTQINEMKRRQMGYAA